MINRAHKNEILGLMRRARIYDMRNVTLMHRNLGAPDHWQGRPVDEWLDSLTFEQGTQLLDKLRKGV